MSRILSALTLVVLALAVGCGGGSGGGGGGANDAGAALTACSAYAGCTSFTDYSVDGGATVSIKFGSQNGNQNAYAPKCIKVKATQTVKFEGDFDQHPLDQGCGPSATRAIPVTKTGTEKSVTFSGAGEYGYFCEFHGARAGTGMAGAIQVVP